MNLTPPGSKMKIPSQLENEKNVQKPGKHIVEETVLNEIREQSDTQYSEKKHKSSRTSTKNSKKSKRPKKEKKKKKKRKNLSPNDDSDSDEEVIKRKKIKYKLETESSSSSDCSSDEWVEKPMKTHTRLKDNLLVRDNWMKDGLMLKTYSKERAEKKPDPTIQSYDPTKSSRELNTYWKSNGTGLPSFQKPKEDDDKYISTNINTYGLKDKKSSSANWKKKSDTKMSSITALEHDQISKQKKKSEVDRPSEYFKIISHPTDNESERNVPSSSSKSYTDNNFLTDLQMNELGAKIIKAEIMGDTNTAKILSDQLCKAREVRNSGKTDSTTKLEKRKTTTAVETDTADHILLTTTDNKGVTRPLHSWKDQPSHSSDTHGKRGRNKKTETHVDGERVRYFPDDDRFDIKQMFEREKYTTAEDIDAQFVQVAGKQKNSKDDLEDVFSDVVRNENSMYDKDDKAKNRAIRDHEQFTSTLANCARCIESCKMEKQLIVCMGTTVYLTLPWHEGLQTGHCLISPIQHISCATQLDEDCWNEINEFRKALTNMFQSKSQDVIFFETARYLNKRPHMVIHCVPSKKFEMAPFFFKKAIQESEQMWSTNKQLISLKDKNLRQAIPKGLPYFWVHFGVDSGFAHVIEDQERFPLNFAQEVIGGILNLHHKFWRNPRRECNPVRKVNQFVQWWKDFDITKK